MKKRLLALTLVLALSLSIAIPGFAANDAGVSDFSGWTVIGTASGTSVGSETSFSIDSTLRIAAKAGDSYAVVKGADVTDGTKKISWKELAGKDIGLDGKMDITKLLKVTADTYLVFYPDTKTKATEVASKTSALQTATLVSGITGIVIPAASTWKIASTDKKPTYSADDEGQWATFATSTSIKLEYAPVNSTNWAPFNGRIEVMPYKQDFNVREAATATKAPSPVSKITVAALTAVPALKFDAAKGEVKLKKGMEYSIDGGAIQETGTEAVTIKMGDAYRVGEDLYTIDAYTSISYRMAADPTKKPGSDWVSNNFIGNLREATELTEEVFCITAKGIEVVGSIPVQLYDTSGSTPKWKNTKVIKATELTTATAAAPKTFTVRMAGTKMSAAGDSMVLTYSGNGVFTVDSQENTASPTSL